MRDKISRELEGLVKLARLNHVSVESVSIYYGECLYMDRLTAYQTVRNYIERNSDLERKKDFIEEE